MEQLLKRTKGDKIIWGVVIVLSLISLMAVYSSTGSLAYRMHKGHTEIYLIKQLGVLMAGILSNPLEVKVFTRCIKSFGRSPIDLNH